MDKKRLIILIVVVGIVALIIAFCEKDQIISKISKEKVSEEVGEPGEEGLVPSPDEMAGPRGISPIAGPSPSDVSRGDGTSATPGGLPAKPGVAPTGGAPPPAPAPVSVPVPVPPPANVTTPIPPIAPVATPPNATTIPPPSPPNATTPSGPSPPTPPPTPLPAHCTNGAWDVDESDLDCGGTCNPCPPPGFPSYLSCWNNNDCITGNCDMSGAQPLPAIDPNTNQMYNSLLQLRFLAGQTWIIPYQGVCK